MRIVVTGGAGFIGSWLVKRLLADGEHSIVVVDNFRRASALNIRGMHPNLVIQNRDIRNAASVQAAIDGADIVYHLAAESSVMRAETDPEYAFSTNVTGTWNVLCAARHARVKRVVLASSREVYGEPAKLPVPEDAAVAPKNVYGASKAAAELVARAFAERGLNVAILRLANVFGPGDQGRVIPHFIARALKHEPIMLYGRGKILDLIWIETVVDVLVRAAFGPSIPAPLNVGSGQSTGLAELARQIIECTGSRSRVEVRPHREIEVRRFVADVSRLRKLMHVPDGRDTRFYLPCVVEWSRNCRPAKAGSVSPK